MARKHYQMDEVIRNLTSKKGCVITTNQPITKSIQDFELPDQEKINHRYARFLKDQGFAVKAMTLELGEDIAHKHFFGKFRKDFPSLFNTKVFYRNIVIQAPFTVNIHNAHDLGNGSWGKIDFLTNHNGYSVMR